MRVLRVLLAVLCVSLGLASLASRASAQAPLINTFGGTLGFGTAGTLPGNDDGSSAAIDLTSAFPAGLRFFGGPYSTFYVNNNGNITFNAPVGGFTPIPFPIAAQPMIAPYWADVDTRGGGVPNNNYVAWHLAPGLLAVTWHNVGYYSIRDELKMDFQLILRNALDCGSGDFDVEFRYNRCEWTTGNASGGSGGFGGTPAQAGFDAGNSVDFVEIPGSRTASILNLCTTSNVGEPGVWRFSVRGGAVICPGAGDACDTGMTGACGLGLTACIGREVMCVAVGTSSSERCDNLDNDCNGMVDDGSGLCGATEVCVEGRCVPPCFEGSCNPAETCTTAGACVETACIGVVCPAGGRCGGGTCIDGCDGITCPHGQQCFAGRCADLCDLLTCAAGEVCVAGECLPQCPCRACEADEICGSDGACTPLGCDITICDPGFYCDGGACLDACDGAVCPAGQYCQLGECVNNPVEPDAGPPPVPDGGGMMVEEDAGSTMEFDAGVPGPIDAGRPVRPPTTMGGCCSVLGNRSNERSGWLPVLGALGLVALRRRTRVG